MLSPALRHKLRHEATAAIAQTAITGQATGAVGDSLHLQLLALEQDIARLRQRERIADRIEMKRRELLPKYRPYVERYLAAGIAHRNELFAQLIIWAFDVGDFDTGIAWALIAIEQHQPTPPNIKRNWATFVADTVLEWAETQSTNGHSVDPWFARVFDLVRNQWRLNERITAKWFRAAGLHLLRDSEGKPLPSAVNDGTVLEQADHWLAEAEKLHAKIGVGTVRHKIAMRLRALSE